MKKTVSDPVTTEVKAVEYHVSTVEELSEIIRNKSGKRIIHLAEGVYKVEDTLELTEDVRIVGVKEKAVLMGSRRISADDWIMGKDGTVTVDLEKAGITDLGRFGQGPFSDFWITDIPKPHMENEGLSLQLYYGEKEMTLSRYPEKGDIRIAATYGENPLYNGEKEICGSKEGVFRPEDTAVFDRKNLEDLQELLLMGYWFFDWAPQKHSVEAYDGEKGIVTVQQPYHNYGYNSDPEDHRGGRFYVLNARSALRKPGDWCINRREKKIYFYPYPRQEYVDISVCENIFMAKEQKNIFIEGITFRNLRRSAVWLEDCRDILIENCDVANCGS